VTNVAIAFSTKDRVELTKQTLPKPTTDFDLFWIDGSSTQLGQDFISEAPDHPSHKRFTNVQGGADAAIVFALTTMLTDPKNYDYVGLWENDVLLRDGWFQPTMDLFEKYHGLVSLEVGAVSARAYVDRVLIQRTGFSAMLNLGAGHVIFTREAAELILANYRTGYWTDTRAIFEHVSGIDIGHFACFRGNQQHTTADWLWDAVLAQHGLASLALTPCMADMIGQDPPLVEQGLKLVDSDSAARYNDDEAFRAYKENLNYIRAGEWRPNVITPIFHSSAANSYLYYAHQLPRPHWEGDWRLKWSQGFGPFAWRAGSDDAKLTVSLYGPVVFLVSGGKNGGKVKIVDTDSGYEISPDLPANQPQNIAAMQVPAGVSYRQIEMTCSEGVVFYGVQTTEQQPSTSEKFDYSKLPLV
jgi:hypothetical protein